MELIEVFGHPWINQYQVKYYPNWTNGEGSSDDDSDEDSSDEDDEEESEEEEYDEETERDEESKTPAPEDASENITYADDSMITPSETPFGDDVSDATSISYQKSKVVTKVQ